MPVWTFANVKGGAGKTTGAVHLATALSQRGAAVCLVDADAQASARRWHRKAAQVGEPLPFTLEFLPTPDLTADIDGLAAAYSHVLIDVGPGNADVMLAAIAVADLVVIPLNAREDDREQAKKTHEDCDRFGVAHVALMSRVKTSERGSVAITREYCRDLGIPLLHSVVWDLVAIGDAFGGLPTSDAYLPVLAELEKLS